MLRVGVRGEVGGDSTGGRSALRVGVHDDRDVAPGEEVRPGGLPCVVAGHGDRW